MAPMLRALLANVSNLPSIVNAGNQAYALVVMKNGPKMARQTRPNAIPQIRTRAATSELRRRRLLARGVDGPACHALVSVDRADRCDRTGLTEVFDLKLEWTREEPFGEPEHQLSPAIFTASPRAARLHSGNRPKSLIETLVIDRADRPAEN
jgi:uncharacterized protein (TIGR03435 family)